MSQSTGKSLVRRIKGIRSGNKEGLTSLVTDAQAFVNRVEPIANWRVKQSLPVRVRTIHHSRALEAFLKTIPQ